MSCFIAVKICQMTFLFNLLKNYFVLSNLCISIQNLNFESEKTCDSKRCTIRIFQQSSSRLPISEISMSRILSKICKFGPTRSLHVSRCLLGGGDALFVHRDSSENNPDVPFEFSADSMKHLEVCVRNPRSFFHFAPIFTRLYWPSFPRLIDLPEFCPLCTLPSGNMAGYPSLPCTRFRFTLQVCGMMLMCCSDSRISLSAENAHLRSGHVLHHVHATKSRQVPPARYLYLDLRCQTYVGWGKILGGGGFCLYLYVISFDFDSGVGIPVTLTFWPWG